MEILILSTVLISLPNEAAKAQNFPITTSSKNALQFFNMGMRDLLNLQYREAAENFGSAIKRDPNFALAYLYRAQCYDDPDSIIYNVNKAIEKGIALKDKISNGERLLLIAVRARFIGDKTEEQSYLDQLLRDYPNNKWILAQLAKFYYRISDYKQILKYSNHFLQADTTFALPYSMIGYASIKLGDYKTAENAFKKYISRVPDNPAPHHWYATLLQMMGRFEESNIQFEKAFSLDNKYVKALIGIGDNYLFEDDFANARYYYHRASQKATYINDRLGAQYNLALLHLYKNQIPEAIGVFHEIKESAIANNVNITALSYCLAAAIILSESDEPELALQEIKEANSIVNDIPGSTKEHLTESVMLYKSYVLLQQGKIAEASKLTNETISIIKESSDQTNIPKLNFVKGMIAFEQDNYKEAISYFRIAEDNPLVWYYTALAYQNSGDKTKGIGLLKKISHWSVNCFELAFVRYRVRQQLEANGLPIN